MAKHKIKSGGPTRGRKRLKRIGMGSGKFLTTRARVRRRDHRAGS